jgi:PhzF family phenazine biosynthesis protein
MASGPHTFTTVDVFTAERYTGNPLAIVSVRGGPSPTADVILPASQKQKIAREFNLSETVFLHDAEPGQPRRADIYTTEQEIPFAGHPTIGVAHYIFNFLEKGRPSDPNGRVSSAILTKAGKINIYYNPYRSVAAAEVPFKYHEHGKGVSREAVVKVQPKIKNQVEKMKKEYPLVSIVKGMTFSLVDLTATPQLLAALEPGIAPEAQLDEEWAPSLVGGFYYAELPPDDKDEPPIWGIRARMISHGIEDPATGSASCALASYLALKKGGKGKMHVFAIQQGTEMGRGSQIAVEVTLDEEGTGVKMLVISGRAVFVTRGEIIL